MELLLNLTWALLALANVCLWLRFEKRSQQQRRSPLVALAMLIIILFPVVSVSDDLWSIQNPAEADTYVRRTLHATNPQSIFPSVAALPEPAFHGINFTFLDFKTPILRPVIHTADPFLASTQNLPPPIA